MEPKATKGEALEMKDINLLVADDDISTLELIETRLNMQGWKGTYVTSASMILEAVNNDPTFDAIIADVNYFDNQPGPRLTGMTAAREIRKVLPNIPIIFITAYANSVIREEIRRLNAELVPKPFELEKLLLRVYQLVYWYRAAQCGTQYRGKEKRFNSINISGEHRRTSDVVIKPSPIVKSVLDELRNKSL